MSSRIELIFGHVPSGWAGDRNKYYVAGNMPEGIFELRFLVTDTEIQIGKLTFAIDDNEFRKDLWDPYSNMWRTLTNVLNEELDKFLGGDFHFLHRPMSTHFCGNLYSFLRMEPRLDPFLTKVIYKRTGMKIKNFGGDYLAFKFVEDNEITDRGILDIWASKKYWVDYKDSYFFKGYPKTIRKSRREPYIPCIPPNLPR